jgi:hypothetical protein
MVRKPHEPIYFTSRHLTLLREGTTWLVCYGDRVMGRVVPNERYLGRWCAQFGDGTLGGELKLRVAIEAVAGYAVHVLNQELTQKSGEVVPFPAQI